MSAVALALFLITTRTALSSAAMQATIGLASPVPIKRRLGSFLVIGDWGFDDRIHGNTKTRKCQQAIADKMHKVMQQLGDVKFIINVGDSFYPRGVTSKSDPQWNTKWRNVYSQELRSVPWYSVYGNHDYQQDPCACASMPHECAQVNSDVASLDYFYMPSYNWWIEHPELGVEVIGLDLNHFEWAWDHEAPDNKRCMLDCVYTKCPAACESNTRYRAKEAVKLLQERSHQSTAKNLLVFSHYPTDYLWKLPKTLEHLRNNSGGRHVEYFGGHRHNVDQTSTISTHPNNNWLVGGGGGWSCDPPKGQEPQQGFLVGQIGEDHELKMTPHLVDAAICCAPLPPPRPPQPGRPGPFCVVTDPW